MPFPTVAETLSQALTARQYAEPTPVQAAVLQPEAAGRDLLVSAQTGSGKTVAFGLAFAETLLQGEPRLGRAGKPLALIIAPTRELAMQVQSELTWLYAHAGARVVTCVGGTDARREHRALTDGCHIVVGTPGRLRDHLTRKQLDPSALRVVVLDEADEMLDMGFREDLEFILDATPPDRRTLLLSATIAKEIAGLAKRYQRDALRIDTIARNQPHADIEYRALRISNGENVAAVVNTLRYVEAGATLVFCATREGVRRMHAELQSRGFTAVALSGELSQNDRTMALQSLRDGRAKVCVATDVAARGLDLPELSLVIHADLPMDRATLLHRSGRTGRAGRKGMCVVLVPYTARRRAEILLNSAGLNVAWTEPPTVEAIRAQDHQRLLASDLLATPADDVELAQAKELLAGQGAEQLAVALLRMHRANLPEPATFVRSPAHRPDTHAPRAPREPRAPQASGDMVWFTLPIGRRDKADPKWLVPLICRQGNVTKQDIGSIRIFDEETKFEIVSSMAEDFAAAMAQSDGAGRAAPGAGAPRPHGKPRPHGRGAAPAAAAGRRPFAKKKYAGASR